MVSLVNRAKNKLVVMKASMKKETRAAQRIYLVFGILVAVVSLVCGTLLSVRSTNIDAWTSDYDAKDEGQIPKYTYDL